MQVINHGRKCDVELHEIVRIESKSNYSVVHLNNNTKITIAKVLHQMEKTVGEQFLRVNRSNLLNKLFISEINVSNNTIYLNNNLQFTISRRRKKQVNLLQLV